MARAGLPLDQGMAALARRYGVVPVAITDSTVEVATADPTDLDCERALGFGAQQLLLQHRGLFDLLQARAEARGDW